jgi:hypothetical protein
VAPGLGSLLQNARGGRLVCEKEKIGAALVLSFAFPRPKGGRWPLFFSKRRGRPLCF